MKKFSIILATLCCCCVGIAQTFEVNGMSYEITSTDPYTVEVTRGYHTNYSGDVVIPNSVTYQDIIYSVTSIGGYVFSGCSGLTSITIPNSVTNIGYSSFKGCTGLTSITIPNLVTSIGDEAFYGCSGLTSITIPNLVTSIGRSVFSDCSGLTSITIPNSVTSIGWDAFRGCTGLTSITIPNLVTSIGSFAFSGCSGLTSINVESGNPVYHSAGNCLIETATKTLIAGCNTSIIPSDGSVTIIEDRAFCDCIGLTNITIPNSVTDIVRNAFDNCTSITSITIPNSVNYIGSNAFRGCIGLTSINVESGNPVYHSAGNCLIETAHKILKVGCKTSIIPSDGSVTIIGRWAFKDCTGLTSITIPDLVTYIDTGAFIGCTGLTSVTCLALTPPGATDTAFEGGSSETKSIIYDNCALYVTAKSLADYQAHKVWSLFKDIKVITSLASVETIPDLQIVGNSVICPVVFTIYNLQGQDVTEQNGSLPAGVYIVCTANAAQKVIL